MINWWQDPYWWVEAVVAIGTIGAVLVALFHEPLQQWVWPTRLEVCLSSPTGTRTQLNIGVQASGTSRREEARYYHLSVRSRGSRATNAAVYLKGIRLRGAGRSWYQAWSGEVPLSWSYRDYYPLLRPVGRSTLSADLFELVKNKWLQLEVAIRPNSLPRDNVPNLESFPGRWRERVEMIVAVEALATEGQSPVNLIYVDWDGGWAEGDSEMARHFNIKPISSEEEV